MLLKILVNWAVFKEYWDGILEGKVDLEIRGKVKGVQIRSLSFIFLRQLGVLVLMHTYNLSSTLLHTHVML